MVRSDRVLMKNTRAVHPIVQGPVCRLEHEPDASVNPFVGPGTRRVDVGQRSLDLFQNRQGIRGGEKRIR